MDEAAESETVHNGLPAQLTCGLIRSPVDEVIVGDGGEDGHIMHQRERLLVKHQRPRRLIVPPPVGGPQGREPEQGLDEALRRGAVGAVIGI